jgi:hypothetical protein
MGINLLKKGLRRAQLSRFEKGSAFILVVVLTTLLMIIGVVFLLSTRVEKMSTSAVMQEKDLKSAVGAVVEQISQQLVWDTPGVDPNGEYYDYPDIRNSWLANLEPFENGGNYFWRQISDVTGYLYIRGFNTQNVNVDVPGSSIYIPEYPEIGFDTVTGQLMDWWADADGDGIADSKWIQLFDMSTSKGEPIYAAIRVIDNSAMINVNTAYKFNPNSVIRSEIDGSSQLQINLAELSQRGANGSLSTAADKLHSWRCNYDANTSLTSYENNVIWQYVNPISGFTPFDISDELELRSRFLINNEDIDTRLETMWDNCLQVGNRRPYDSDFADWKLAVDFSDPNEYDYRHLATTYNMDRIIHPPHPAITSPTLKMINVNDANVNSLYEGIYAGLYSAGVADAGLASQIAVNLRDYVDSDSNVTVYNGYSNDYYGFERPCVYISELAYIPVVAGPNTYEHYAVELYKPYFEDDDPVGWQLVIDGNPIPVDWSTGSRRFYVRFFTDSNDPDPNGTIRRIVFFDANEPADVNDPYDPSSTLYNPADYLNPRVDDYDNAVYYQYHFVAGSEILLTRPVGEKRIIVDRVDLSDVNPPWPSPTDTESSVRRDIYAHRCIRRLWSLSALPGQNLGTQNQYTYPSEGIIQAHPKNRRLTNIGEVGMVFQKNAYLEGEPLLWIGQTDTQESVLVNLAEPAYQYLFNYLTVLDPADHNNPPVETRVKGRININTAPWFVLAQLPWVSSRVGFYDSTLAENIANYREINGAYKSIGELYRIPLPGIDYYSLDNIDQEGFPDITPVKEFEPGDGAIDDFEERDIIFTRISDLVTVRSDVFTAYILVRLGQNGPQKRVIAILDRSEVDSPNDKVKVLALYQVPDPR